MPGHVPHSAVLNAFRLLHRIVPTATVDGSKETARVGDLVFTLELAQTIRSEQYSGLRLRTINPAVGELDVRHLSFSELRVTTGRARRELHTLTAYETANLADGIHADLMVTALRQHIAHFTGTELH